MAATDSEEERLRSVAMQNARSVLLARQRAEEALRKQSEWLRITLSSIGDAIISTDAESRVTFMNAVAESLTGWTQSEAAGRPLTDIFQIVNERTRQPVLNPALQALEEGIVVGLANHTVLISRDGTERPIDDSAAPIRDGDAPPVGAVLVFRDVTDRKRAEATRVQLAAIIESSDDAVISKTLNGVIQTWNAGAERLFGYTPAEAVGRPITLIIPPERQDEERTILERLRRGQRIEHFETVRAAKDGRRLDISLTVSPLRDEDGVVIGASKVARDITAQKQASAERGRLAETLELALAAADLGTWDWDPTTDRIILSDRAAEIYGLQAQQRYTREWMRGLIRSDHRNSIRDAARRSVTERSEYDVEYPLDRAIDRPHWVAVRGRGVYDAAGNLLRMLGVVQDVTARKEDEAALRASEDRHRFLADLATATQPLTEPGEVMAAAARLLAEYLAVDRCAYAEVEGESIFIVTGDHSRGVPSIVGRWPVSAFGAACMRQMLANQPFVANDVDADSQIGPNDLPAFRATGVRAIICIPLHKNGKFSAALAVHQKTPRQWTSAEIELVRTVGGRCWDALERARVTRTLRETEARFRRLISAGIIGVIRWDLDRSLILDANDEFLRMSGYERQDLAAGRLNFREMTPPEWVSRNEAGIRELRETGVGGAYEKEYFRKDGERVPVIMVGVRFEETTSEGMSFVLDITERKRTEEALARITAESERRRRLYETILSNTPDLIYVFDLDHRFTYANEALLRMWGLSGDDAIGKNCLESVTLTGMLQCTIGISARSLPQRGRSAGRFHLPALTANGSSNIFSCRCWAPTARLRPWQAPRAMSPSAIRPRRI
jgi:PAS domain S-box-containing protein